MYFNDCKKVEVNTCQRGRCRRYKLNLSGLRQDYASHFTAHTQFELAI